MLLPKKKHFDDESLSTLLIIDSLTNHFSSRQTLAPQKSEHELFCSVQQALKKHPEIVKHIYPLALTSADLN